MTPLLAPLLASLASNGLNLLASAVQAKGKEVIESKLGVSLDSASPQELLTLQQEHEEFLLSISIKEKEMELADMQSARNLGVELSKSQYWLAANIMPMLALFTVVASFAVLVFSTENDVRMAAVSMGTMVLGYFFGSSVGSKAKQEQLDRMQK